MTLDAESDELGRMLRLVVAYDGRGFAGSQRQAGQRTVQGELERASVALFGEQVRCRLAGRTDSGVHAVGQVAGVLIGRKALGTETVQRAYNGLLPADLSVASVTEAPLAFDPRRDARWRAYRYRIWLGPRHPLLEGLALQVASRLDVDAMCMAAECFIGEHDFGGFAGMGAGVPGSCWQERPRGTRRAVFACEAVQDVGESLLPRWGRLIEIRVVGDAFLPRQVRGMVGALLEVGQGRRTSESVAALLREPRRQDGPKTAPAHGLVLWEVGYTPWGTDSGPMAEK